ncbi:cytochrome c oxidase subunit II [Celeribacter arenosi]|uniref:Cytochrome c oxidase subunit 2 n=1 Tax=Celeribacter arenosi TaxID=792649 RepID=A0ABP7K890_9RHOB
MRNKTLFAGITAASTAMMTASAALAQQSGELLGAPVPRGIDFQPAATELARDIHRLDGMLNWVMGAIVLFVLVLIAIVIVRYNARVNKTPAKFTHNTSVEIAWTLIPVIILVVIGIFSLPVLFKQQEIPEGDIYIKVTGYQWFWGYEYVDEGFGFESFLLAKEELAENGYTDDLYLLATDTAVVVPVGKTVVMGVTGADVIHAWTIPAFGVKQDAVPGRVAELWFKAEKTGTFFGQCSELCGKDHAYMPITVKVVSEEEYAAWLEGARDLYASVETDADVVRVAASQ